MSNIKKILLLTLLLAIVAPAAAQKPDEIIKPRKRQHAAFYLKAYYNNPEYNFVTNIKDDIARSKTMGVMSHSSLGFSYRIPVWRYLYLQPEFQYSLHTDWDSAALRSNFFSQTIDAFKRKESSNFDIPIYIGARWEPVRIFAARAYAGAMVRFCRVAGEFNLYDNYQLRAGVGLDLLNLLCIDVGYSVEMNKLTIYDDTALYFLALSIKL